MDFDTRIKLAIYGHFAETGRGPTSGDVAELVGSDVQSVLDWYSTRLQENSRRPQPEEMRAIFGGLGLEGDFWDPRSDSFG